MRRVPAGLPVLTGIVSWQQALYANGWHTLQQRLSTPGPAAVQARNPHRLLVDVVCARTAPNQMPLAPALDRLRSRDGVASSPLLPWAEWAVFRWRGDVERLSSVYDAIYRSVSRNGSGMAAERAIGLWSLAHLASYLDSSPDGPDALLGQARKVLAHDEASEERPLLDAIARVCLYGISGMGSGMVSRLTDSVLARLDHSQDETSAAAGERPLLLLLDALRFHHEADLVHMVSRRALEQLRSTPLRAYLAPTLLLEGICGLDAEAAKQALTWWLWSNVPTGVESLRPGAATLSLEASRPGGAGTELLVRTSHEWMLEVITPETTFVEYLRPGRHRLTLTVLDRTDVKEA